MLTALTGTLRALVPTARHTPEALRDSRTLKTLVLEHCLGDATGTAVAQALQHNTSLTKLQVDCENMGDEAYMEFLQSQQGKLAALLAGEGSDYGDEGPELESPLDDIDEFVFFAEHWQQALGREQAMQQLQAALPPEQQGLVQQLIQFAAQRQQDAAAEQQQQAASPPAPPATQ